jgi:hypothetical protein
MVLADDGTVQLLAGRCESCGTLVFPAPTACPVCASTDIAGSEVGRTGGTLFLWTVVQTAPPGYEGPVPYGFGVVELDEGMRVLGRLLANDASDLIEGMRMRCVADVVATDDDGGPLVAWGFAPDEAGPA